MERIICLAIGYVCGLLQSGYLVGKLHHIDIRKSGSGNAGSTNALRVMGWKAGLMTFAGDVLKCFAAVLIVRGLYHGSNCLALLMMYAGAGVTLGHNFPFYMKFKGGKGIAVMAALTVSNCFWHLPYSVLMFFITLHSLRSCSSDKVYFTWITAGVCRILYRNGRIWAVRMVWNGTGIPVRAVHTGIPSDGTCMVASPCEYQKTSERNRE